VESAEENGSALLSRHSHEKKGLLTFLLVHTASEMRKTASAAIEAATVFHLYF
jgi:hypothetical protein